jgi:hypothetical protein
LQQLATVCSFLLVLMSAVLLRSQSLISSARQINFNPQRPGVEPNVMNVRVRGITPLQTKPSGAVKTACL